MVESKDRVLKRLFNTFVLWVSGWRRRKYLLYRQPIIRWRDPESSLWYDEEVALQLVTIRARDQIE